ncbi:hypothetical protein PO79_15880 [Vibrio parahaemolyticus]|nr:hypothetical protein PO79_15880 [Vibrio parahaemolyticus]
MRFVALILKGARINEILALTFTKKAANEMQKRIIETFLNLEKENKTSECNELCKLLGKDKEELICEAADLMYHLSVLLADANLSFSDVISKLKERHKA